jgi:hypothetical protein
MMPTVSGFLPLIINRSLLHSKNLNQNNPVLNQACVMNTAFYLILSDQGLIAKGEQSSV